MKKIIGLEYGRCLISTQSRHRIIRMPEIIKITGASKSTIYRWIKNKKFPDRCKLSERMSGWLYGDIIDWLQSKGQIEEDAAHDN
jgi:prophage regulatory protein